MTVNISPAGGVAAQFFTDDGIPLAGGKLYSYAANSSTPQATYTDSTGATARSNPIILNSAGRVPDSGEIWLTTNLAYKFLLKDSTDVLIASYDNVSGIGDTTALLDFEALLAGATGASLVGYLPATGPAITVQAALIALQAQDVNISALVSINGGQIAGLRNRIINGDMRIAQRGAVSSVGYSLDRWYLSASGSVPTVDSVTGYSVSINYWANVCRVTGIAGNTDFSLRQRIEAANCADLANSPVTVGYYVYQNTGSTVSASTDLDYASATNPNDFSSTTGITNGLPPVSVPSGTWTKVTAQFSVPNAAYRGLQLNIMSAASPVTAGQLYYFANVQLEIGNVSTIFEQRPIGLELALCQRYYEVVTGYPVYVVDNQLSHVGYRVTKRTTPTVVLSSGTINGNTVDGFNASVATGSPINFSATSSAEL